MGISSLVELKSGFMITNVVSILPLFLSLGIAAVLFMVAGLVGVWLLTGIFGMAAEALRGVTKVKTMLEVAKEYGLTGIITSIIVFLTSLILMILFMVGLSIAFSVPGLVVGTIAFLLVMVFFSVTFPGIIVDDLGPIETIGKSFYVVKKNYPDIFALLLFYVIVSLILSFIPFIGQLIWYFVIVPMSCITLVLFYKRNKF
jgi:hypothetical protein